MQRLVKWKGKLQCRSVIEHREKKSYCFVKTIENDATPRKMDGKVAMPCKMKKKVARKIEKAAIGEKQATVFMSKLHGKLQYLSKGKEHVPCNCNVLRRKRKLHSVLRCDGLEVKLYLVKLNRKWTLQYHENCKRKAALV